MNFADPTYRDPVYGHFRYLLEYRQWEVPMYLHPGVVEETGPNTATRFQREHDIGLAVEATLSRHVLLPLALGLQSGVTVNFPVQATFHDNQHQLSLQVHVEFAGGAPLRIRVDPPATEDAAQALV